MKLKKYKPEIEFIAFDVENNVIIPEGSLAFEEYLPVDDLLKDTDELKILPYINSKDANGNKLYLFDVIEGKFNKAIIVFDNCYNGFLAKTLPVNGGYRKIINIHNICKRIGNIYELPELQKEFNL